MDSGICLESIDCQYVLAIGLVSEDENYIYYFLFFIFYLKYILGEILFIHCY